ncbi:hypothetical protein SALBM311S_01978 [Streptomyces alboniger]
MLEAMIPRPGLHVIFDLHGTLVDSEPNVTRPGAGSSPWYGVSDFSWEDHTRFIGIGTRQNLHRPAGRVRDR